MGDYDRAWDGEELFDAWFAYGSALVGNVLLFAAWIPFHDDWRALGNSLTWPTFLMVSAGALAMILHWTQPQRTVRYPTQLAWLIGVIFLLCLSAGYVFSLAVVFGARQVGTGDALDARALMVAIVPGILATIAFILIIDRLNRLRRRYRYREAEIATLFRLSVVQSVIAVFAASAVLAVPDVLKTPAESVPRLWYIVPTALFAAAVASMLSALSHPFLPVAGILLSLASPGSMILGASLAFTGLAAQPDDPHAVLLAGIVIPGIAAVLINAMSTLQLSRIGPLGGRPAS